VHTFGDAHLYCNHLDQARTQLEREPLPLPQMHLNPDVKDLFSFRYEDFELVDYQSPSPHQGPHCRLTTSRTPPPLMAAPCLAHRRPRHERGYRLRRRRALAASR
jgi:hypothetical protein